MPALQKLLRLLPLIVLYAMPLLLSRGRAYADIGISSIAIWFLLYSVFTRSADWLKAWDVKLLIALWVFFCLRALMMGDGAGDGLKVTLMWIRFPLFYAALRYHLLVEDAVRTRLGYVALITVALLVVDCAVQYHTGISLTGNPKFAGRLTGPLSFPNVGALILKLMLVASVLLAVAAPRVLLGALLAASMIIILSGERGSLMLLLLALVISVVSMAALLKNHRRMIAAATLVFMACSAAAIMQPYVQYRISVFEAQMNNFATSDYGQIYSAAGHIWLENPLLGAGVRQFNPACSALVKRGVVAPCVECGVTQCNIHAHNTYLQLLSETGLAGILIYLAFVAVCLRQWWAAQRGGNYPHPAIFILSGTALLVLLFPFINTQSFFANWPAALFWFALASVMSVVATRK